MSHFDDAAIAKFWSRVDRRGPDECWNWVGKIIPAGYGHFLAHGKEYRAHRLALRFAKEPESEALLACHTCDNKRCCNPGHMYWGTKSQNALDAYDRSPGLSSVRKLLPSQAAYIKKLLANGYSRRECADWYGVSLNTIISVARGYSYRMA